MSSSRVARSNQTETPRVCFDESDHNRVRGTPARPAAFVVGRIVAVTEDGRPLVDYSGNPHGPSLARSLLQVDTPAAETELLQGGVLLMLPGDCDQREPLIVGRITNSIRRDPRDSANGDAIRACVVVEAHEQIILKCGDSSLRLEKNGRVTTKGKHLVSRSSGANKIRGASIQLN